VKRRQRTRGASRGVLRLKIIYLFLCRNPNPHYSTPICSSPAEAPDDLARLRKAHRPHRPEVRRHHHAEGRRLLRHPVKVAWRLHLPPTCIPKSPRWPGSTADAKCFSLPGRGSRFPGSGFAISKPPERSWPRRASPSAPVVRTFALCPPAQRLLQAPGKRAGGQSRLGDPQAGQWR